MIVIQTYIMEIISFRPVKKRHVRENPLFLIRPFPLRLRTDRSKALPMCFTGTRPFFSILSFGSSWINSTRTSSASRSGQISARIGEKAKTRSSRSPDRRSKPMIRSSARRAKSGYARPERNSSRRRVLRSRLFASLVKLFHRVGRSAPRQSPPGLSRDRSATVRKRQ